jgi:hypothetical protein
MRWMLTTLALAATLVTASACTNVRGTVVGNAEDGAACPNPPKTFALSVETSETHVDSAGNTVKTIRTVCVDSGLAGTYKVGSTYP